jgi:hypothetical protein
MSKATRQLRDAQLHTAALRATKKDLRRLNNLLRICHKRTKPNQLAAFGPFSAQVAYYLASGTVPQSLWDNG